MEGGKRVGAALLVLLVAVACFVNQSSARSHPGLDFLDRVMNKASAATAKCDICICMMIWPERCICVDQFDCCPSWCKDCEEVDGNKYVCLDVNSDQCKLPSSSDTNRMIKLPHGHE
uniref:Bowman-Birk serine protease inhibitors family domain-containing protein n=1 Tax=Ananas comosus var. bracteatus TaxID=296719 RepID=A0A6V7QKF4_ANACO|nr:unnamed protein product [Ananas comosus var. bracteatus]